MIELLFEESNFAIVKLPKRQFPGVVIQGDSLAIIYALASELRDSVTNTEAKEIAEELCQHIKQKLDRYEEILQKNKMPLPYVRTS